MIAIGVLRATEHGPPIFLAIVDGFVVARFEGPDAAKDALAFAVKRGIANFNLRTWLTLRQTEALQVPVGYAVLIFPGAVQNERYSFMRDGDTASRQRFGSEGRAADAARDDMQHSFGRQ